MEEYMTKTQEDYGSGIAQPKIDEKARFELKGQFLKELRDNTFSGSDTEDANEHNEKVLEIVDLFHIPEVTRDQLMLRVFPMSLTGAANRWLRNEPAGLLITWEPLKIKFMSKYCPPIQTAKKMEEINNFHQEPEETLYKAWERCKELLLSYPQHYLTYMQEKAIQDMADYSQKWHNGMSTRTRSINTSDGLDVIQAQLNNLRREIKKVNEKVYAAQVGCESCGGQHYTKDCPLKEEGKTLEEANYTQFGVPFPQGGRYRAASLGFYQRDNGNPSYQEQRQTIEESLSKFMAESAKRHDKNSNLIKEVRASMDAAIRNQGASIKALEIQIGQMSKVLQERGSGSLPGSTKTNPRDHVKSISTTVEADTHSIGYIEPSRYTVSSPHNMMQFFKPNQSIIPFPYRLIDDSYQEKDVLGELIDRRESATKLKMLLWEKPRMGYQIKASINVHDSAILKDSLPLKLKDTWSFTIPCHINNICFEKALADLGASVSVMTYSTFTNLGLGELAPTNLIIELVDRTKKHPKGIAENVLVGINKFIFPIDFIVLDMPEDIKVPLILRRPFLSTAHAKIDVFKKKIALRVGDDKIVYKSDNPTSNIIKRVYVLGLRERMELDLEASPIGEALILNRSLDPTYEDYI
ncbi:hypothetical protein Tco_0713380 [Tanacetum coccineum]